MRKVGSTTDTADANGEYTNGNVAQGIPPTIINAEMLNTFQRELIGVVEGSGRQLDPENDNQLKEVIGELRVTSLLSDPIVGALTSQGYCIIPTQTPSGGKKNIIVQMGTGTINAPSGTVQYPIPFPKRVIAIVATKYADGNRSVSVTNDSNSAFGAYGWISGSTSNADNFGWIAIGE
ncbi:gp53-like domain-containing protein [Serratia marcescens]